MTQIYKLKKECLKNEQVFRRMHVSSHYIIRSALSYLQIIINNH